MGFMRSLMLATALGLAAPALADAPREPHTSLQSQVEATLDAAPKGARFGLLVVDEAGTVLVGVNPDQRFIPASNTKMFTTAAAYALLPGMDQLDVAGGARAWLQSGKHKAAADVVLMGMGDARLSSAPDCLSDCLAVLADMVAARTKLVGDVIGDDSRFPDQRWSPGMSWNNLGSNDATAASALSLDSNELMVRANPGAVGHAPLVDVPPYMTVRNQAMTSAAGGKSTLILEHTLNSREFRLYGELPADAGAWTGRIGVDDPADFTAWAFANMLAARGVKVMGHIKASHRPYSPPRSIASFATAPGVPVPGLIALSPPPLADDISVINKVSQNLHAELLLRRIALVKGSGSLQDGLAAERAVFDEAGIPREGYDFSDGSGMSTYNRVSPRAAVSLLRWIATQPWGKAWYASLPIAGVDGTLKKRFVGTPLAGNLIAKTGTLNATNAISGTFRAASGRNLTFAFFANDVPDDQSAVAAMEAVLLAVAASS
jgi:D-alanyl-D-alanine carboxypeptidase/D-alanyl-D-alanine-endopeptidase (penicillin-binding protein 4)